MVLTAIFAFIATNLDDMFILAALFSHPDFRAIQVVLGQYLGFFILLSVSSLAYFTQFVVPATWISLLGVFPIAIGIRNLILLKKNEKLEGNDLSKEDVNLKSNNSLFSVAMVTVANGGDNLGVYMPLFATMNPHSLIITAFTFLIMVGGWCFLGYKLVNNRIWGDEIRKYGHLILPFMMICIGVMIILKGWL